MWKQYLPEIRNSFRIRLIVSLSIIISLAFGATGYYTYQSNLKLFEEEISKQFTGTNDEALAKLDLQVDEIVRISQSIVFNPEIERLVSRIKDAVNMKDEDAFNLFNLYTDRRQIEDQIFQIKTNAPYITGMYLYDLDGNSTYFDYTTSAIKKFNPQTFDAIRSDLTDSYGELKWSSMSLPSSIEPSGFRKSIIISRYMKNSFLQTYGILVMSIDESFFSGSLKELTKDGKGEVYLFNSDKELLYSNSSQQTQEHFDFMRNLEQNQVINQHLFVQGVSDKALFKLVSGTSLTKINDKNRELLQKFVYTGLVSISITAILIALSTSTLLRPLKDLLLGLRRVRSGDFDAQIEIRTKDELAYIGESFNAMTQRVGQLIKEVYERQLSEREAELKAIQAQLNPHFLHNMLNEIYWKLYLQNEKDTAVLIAALSEMLKYSLMPVHTPTTLREEIGQIRNYVKLQTELFESDLETIIQIEDRVMECEITRFLLQPLVENVFVHAFRNKISQKVLVIKARECDGFLEIEVTDNGCGMDDAIISNLLEYKRDHLQRSDGRESIGVRSVVRRIDLVYGPPYHMTIQSIVESGTTMKLLLPCTIRQEEATQAC